MVNLNFNAVAFEQKFHLGYLVRYMDTMELQFKTLYSETKTKVHEELKQSGIDENSEDYQLEMSVIEHQFVDKYPQIFREQMLASI
ncbi:hypothetical protein [Arenicella xantha]|uniref:Uncharacterized protein n=1 Tax=Arenicella xantha TaxID=644221 RepID=A0A395JMX0_9GAMM|nr:hypothetical protein [Arenicella xantha]RBP53001.1 hypothetical protein DFR28_101385 [Arenicella xantha]